MKEHFIFLLKGASKLNPAMLVDRVLLSVKLHQKIHWLPKNISVAVKWKLLEIFYSPRTKNKFLNSSKQETSLIQRCSNPINYFGPSKINNFTTISSNACKVVSTMIFLSGNLPIIMTTFLAFVKSYPTNHRNRFLSSNISHIFQQEFTNLPTRANQLSETFNSKTLILNL